ncbi:hypothetical protein ACF1BQ_029830 [Bradyrhizobium sp. RDT10]
MEIRAWVACIQALSEFSGMAGLPAPDFDPAGDSRSTKLEVASGCAWCGIVLFPTGAKRIRLNCGDVEFGTTFE